MLVYGHLYLHFHHRQRKQYELSQKCEKMGNGQIFGKWLDSRSYTILLSIVKWGAIKIFHLKLGIMKLLFNKNCSDHNGQNESNMPRTAFEVHVIVQGKGDSGQCKMETLTKVWRFRSQIAKWLVVIVRLFAHLLIQPLRAM